MRLKIKILILFVLLLSQILFAQFSLFWTKEENISSPHIYSALFDGDEYYVATDSLHISTDGGTTWRSFLPVNGEIDFIESIVKANGYLYIGSSGGRGVFRTSDNGVTWHEHNNGLSGWSKIVKQFLLVDNLLYLGTEAGVYYLDINYDNEWIEYNENLPSLYAWTVNAMCYSGNNLIISSGFSGFYYIRPEGSPGWIEKTLTGTEQGPTPFSFLAIGDTVFTGAAKTIFRSTNNGLTWDSVGIRALPLEVGAFARHNNRIYASFKKINEFFVWYSDDGGNTWDVRFHEYAQLSKLYADGNRLYVCTFYNGLWYHDLETTSAPVEESDFDFVLQQNYPNPFNPVTNIEFRVAPSQLTEGEALVFLKIYDILGIEVASLINEKKPSGNYKIQFDGSGLPSGVYFYKLAAGNFTETKKMVLLR